MLHTTDQKSLRFIQLNEIYNIKKDTQGKKIESIREIFEKEPNFRAYPSAKCSSILVHFGTIIISG